LSEEVLDAVEAFEEKTGRRAVIALWKDLHLTACWVEGEPAPSCYTTSRASESNRQLYYVLQSFLADVYGMKIRALK
jgi:hypothetical protein